MALKIVLVFLACLAMSVDAARVKKNAKDSDDDALHGESLVQAEPQDPRQKVGAAVQWESPKSGKTYDAVVQDFQMVPQVTLKFAKSGREKMVPLDEMVKIVSDEPEPEREKPEPEREKPEREKPERDGPELNLRQKIVCDACLKKVKTCEDYVPAPGLLNPVRPEPDSPNGRYWQCSPSERELWSSDNAFKVLEDGTSALGDRTKCPGGGIVSERRAAKKVGKLSLARRICKLALRNKKHCSDLVNEKAGVFGRPLVVCDQSVLSRYPTM